MKSGSVECAFQLTPVEAQASARKAGENKQDPSPIDDAACYMTVMGSTKYHSGLQPKRVSRVIAGFDLHGWEQIMVVTLFAAGLVAIAVAVATACVVILTRHENAQTKTEYEAYKLTVEGKVADAKKEGIEAGKSAGSALLRAAELEKQAAALKAANLALEAKVAPRRLTGENLTKLADALSKMVHLPIGIVSRLFDPESTDFADDLAQSFSRANWTPVRQNDWTMSNKGLALATFEGTAIPADLSAELLAALSLVGLKAEIITIKQSQQNTTSAGFQPNTLYITVGAKP
ncbi:hypothetical protein MTR72_16245 [Bradyrhizobium sp. ISRA442]|uniref:hypothetical protein n=1 Tax=Bradyrhizobium sp. ISRA442 TaxID=2866197 RepID=UPI00311ADEA8